MLVANLYENLKTMFIHHHLSFVPSGFIVPLFVCFILFIFKVPCIVLCLLYKIVIYSFDVIDWLFSSASGSFGSCHEFLPVQMVFKRKKKCVQNRGRDSNEFEKQIVNIIFGFQNLFPFLCLMILLILNGMQNIILQLIGFLSI